MPLTEKGEKIKRALIKKYGAKRGKEIFFKMESSKKIKGVKK